MKRPLGVTILIVTVLIFTSLNVLRVGSAIQYRDFLTQPQVTVPLNYLVISGSVWAGLGIALIIGTLVRQKWSIILMKICTSVYVAYYWVDRLLIADRSSISSRWLFATGLTIALIILIFWILTRPKTKAYLVR